jgi:hypothetical protein
LKSQNLMLMQTFDPTTLAVERVVNV